MRVRQLYAVKWSLVISERIDNAIAQASPKSHHEPLELYPRAYTPDELLTRTSNTPIVDDLVG